MKSNADETQTVEYFPSGAGSWLRRVPIVKSILRRVRPLHKITAQCKAFGYKGNDNNFEAEFQVIAGTSNTEIF